MNKVKLMIGIITLILLSGCSNVSKEHKEVFKEEVNPQLQEFLSTIDDNLHEMLDAYDNNKKYLAVISSEIHNYNDEIQNISLDYDLDEKGQEMLNEIEDQMKEVSYNFKMYVFGSSTLAVSGENALYDNDSVKQLGEEFLEKNSKLMDMVDKVEKHYK